MVFLVIMYQCDRGGRYSHYIVSNSCNPMDCSLPGSSVHGISQERILKWISISFSRGLDHKEG